MKWELEFIYEYARLILEVKSNILFLFVILVVSIYYENLLFFRKYFLRVELLFIDSYSKNFIFFNSDAVQFSITIDLFSDI